MQPVIISSRTNRQKIPKSSKDLDLVELRRRLHQIPELGFEEYKTSQFISQFLTKWGIEHQIGIAKTGIVVTIKGNRAGRTLAIRADMDALPIQEENKVSYRSSYPGVMHACGHDGHCAIALGVAYHLAKHRNFAGTVKIIFQPAEEGLGGAKAMIEAGVLEAVDAIIGLHLWNNLSVGTVGVREGALMAASEAFNCTILGKGGHGGMPHQTVDAVVVGAFIIQAFQTIVSRNIDPLDAAVITIGQLLAGKKRNVIADIAQLNGTVRYFNPALAQFLPQRIEQVIKGVCELFGANYELDYQQISPSLINHPKITELVRSAALSVVETPPLLVSQCQTLASEDFAYYLEKVPGCFFFLGSANAAKSLNYPHHHPLFDFDESALKTGVEILLKCVENFCI
jgi:amidohydrolase